MERKKKNEHIYTLRLTKRQVELLSYACDRFSRLIIGQDWTYQELFEQAWEKRCKEAVGGHGMDDQWDGGWQEMRHDAEELGRVVKKRFWGLDSRAMYGIHYDDVADILFSLHQVLRHQLWLDKPEDKKSHITVDSDTPMPIGSEPLARIERNDGNYKRPVLVCYCAKCGKPYYASALNRHGDGLAILDLDDVIDAAVSDGDRMEIYYGKENPLKDICKCGKEKSK